MTSLLDGRKINGSFGNASRCFSFSTVAVLYKYCSKAAEATFSQLLQLHHCATLCQFISPPRLPCWLHATGTNSTAQYCCSDAQCPQQMKLKLVQAVPNGLCKVQSDEAQTNWTHQLVKCQIDSMIIETHQLYSVEVLYMICLSILNIGLNISNFIVYCKITN